MASKTPKPEEKAPPSGNLDQKILDTLVLILGVARQSSASLASIDTATKANAALLQSIDTTSKANLKVATSALDTAQQSLAIAKKNLDAANQGNLVSAQILQNSKDALATANASLTVQKTAVEVLGNIEKLLTPGEQSVPTEMKRDYQYQLNREGEK
jgi:hypothetical protein